MLEHKDSGNSTQFGLIKLSGPLLSLDMHRFLSGHEHDKPKVCAVSQGVHYGSRASLEGHRKR